MIDWKKKYGKVTPPLHGGVFEQDGKLYRPDGTRAYAPGEKHEPAPAPKPAPKPAPPAEAGPKRHQDHPADDGDESRTDAPPPAPKRGRGRPPKVEPPVAPVAPPPVVPPVPPVAPATGEVDLAAWARGDKKYLFGRVRDLIAAKFSIDVSDERSAVDALLSEDVVQPDEVRVVALI
jgi:hypothetical protein